MADEITVVINATISKSPLKDSFRPGQIKYTLSGTKGGNPGTVTIGTSEENISFGDVSPGLVFILNLDSTNFVEFGKDDASTMKEIGKISAGKFAVFELATGETLRMKADTASVDCLIKGYPIT